MPTELTELMRNEDGLKRKRTYYIYDREEQGVTLPRESVSATGLWESVAIGLVVPVARCRGLFANCRSPGQIGTGFETAVKQFP